MGVLVRRYVPDDDQRPHDQLRRSDRSLSRMSWICSPVVVVVVVAAAVVVVAVVVVVVVAVVFVNPRPILMFGRRSVLVLHCCYRGNTNGFVSYVTTKLTQCP